MTNDLKQAWARRREAPLAVSPDVVGYIGLDVPTELIRAAGCAPVRVIAAPSHEGAEAYAEGLGNPALRGLAGALLEGPYRGLRRLVISPTPAAYGWLYAFLREARPGGMEVVLFDLNHGTSPGLQAVRRRSVEGLANTLAEWTGRRLEVEGAIAEANASRGALRRLEALRSVRALGGVHAQAAFGAAEAMSVADYQAALGTVQGATATGRAVIYSGAETVDGERYAALEAAGMVVVGDDQDLGSRAIGEDVAQGGDPLAALGEAYAARTPAPAKSSLAARAEWLKRLAHRSGARGVVFNVSPYDHPGGWETPTLKSALAAEGIEVSDV